MRSVSDIRSNLNEQIEYAAKIIGRKESHKYMVFEAVYFHKSRSKTIEYIIERTGLTKIQVQKASAGLAAKGLISKSKDKGVQQFHADGDLWGHKSEVLKLADSPTSLKNLPTKRRPSSSVTTKSSPIKKRDLKKKAKLKILFLAANPDSSNPLRVDVEIRRVQGAIRGSIYRDNIELHIITAADQGALVDGLNDFRPQIVHFSGHSNDAVIAMDNVSVSSPSQTPVTYSLLAKIFAAVDQPPSLVILNSCESSAGVGQILKVSKAVVSMSASVSDIAAASFSPRFFAALASGQSLRSAFEQGRNAVEAASISEIGTPELHYEKSLDPSKFHLT
jgi:hypothetical protein